MDVREFIEARLRDDEATARAAEALDTDWPFWVEVDDEAVYEAANEFRSRCGPARVLRDVQSKRAILKAVDRWTDPHPGLPHHSAVEGACDLCFMTTRVDPEVLRMLALSWSDHPDFDPSWAVS